MTTTRVSATTGLMALGLVLGLVLRAAFAEDAVKVSFQRDIAPLLKDHCAPCHLTGEEGGHMSLYPAAAYKTLVGVPSTESPLPRVKPGEPDQSYVVRKLEGTHIEAGGSGMRMPLEGGPLEAAEIKLIRSWISEGAQQN